MLRQSPAAFTFFPSRRGFPVVSYILFSDDDTWQRSTPSLWESQQKDLDLHVPIVRPLGLAGEVVEILLNPLQDLVQVAVEDSAIGGKLRLGGEDVLEGGSDIVAIDIRIITVDSGLELESELLDNAGLDHGHKVANRGRVSADVVHVVAVGHGPVDAEWGLDDTVGVVAVALELGIVLKDGVKDGGEDGLCPGSLGLVDRVLDGLDSGGDLCAGECLFGDAVEQRLFDSITQEGEVGFGDEVVLFGEGARDVDLALTLAGEDRGSEEGHGDGTKDGGG